TGAGRAARPRPHAAAPGRRCGVGRPAVARQHPRRAGRRVMATRTETSLDLDAVIADPARRIIVCCGSGGVGKTTTAAALAVRAAEQGRRVVVLTIDPARRLAQSLGLGELDNTP